MRGWGTGRGGGACPGGRKARAAGRAWAAGAELRRHRGHRRRGMPACRSSLRKARRHAGFCASGGGVGRLLCAGRVAAARERRGRGCGRAQSLQSYKTSTGRVFELRLRRRLHGDHDGLEAGDMAVALVAVAAV